MAKIQTGISIDKAIYDGAKAIAEIDRRNFSTVVEIALEQYIEAERARRVQNSSLLRNEAGDPAPAILEVAR